MGLSFSWKHVELLFGVVLLLLMCCRCCVVCCGFMFVSLLSGGVVVSVQLCGWLNGVLLLCL